MRPRLVLHQQSSRQPQSFAWSTARINRDHPGKDSDDQQKDSLHGRRTPMPEEQIARDGRLSPWVAPVTGEPGWQITIRSRRLALAVATILTGTVHPHEKGEWQARLPEAVLKVAVTGAGNGTLWCRLSARPSLGIFTLTFAPWPAALVLRCLLTALPAQGRLSVRDVRLTTRMGRTVRYLISAFTTP